MHRMASRTGFRAALLLSALVLLCASLVQAQDYPSRFIRIIVGPGPDIIARFFGPKITEALGQDVVVEPRPGAGGIIAAQAVANAPPDGYMLLMNTASYTIGSALGTMPHHPVNDYVPVGLAATAPFVLVVHPSVKAANVQELIALAKANPGTLNYASSGIGTPPHLAGELFKSLAGLDIVHVPFREANSAMTAVLQGSVQMMFAIASVAQSQVASGTVRALGVSTLEPTAIVPGLTTIAHAGVPGFEVRAWNGFVAPRGTPAAIAGKLNAAIQRGLDDADLRTRLQKAGYDPAPKYSADQFGAFMADDLAKWTALVKKANIRAN